MQPAFTAFEDADWQFEAGARYREINGAIRPDHDPNLVKTLTSIDLGDRLPTMWPQFVGLRKVPVLVVRGENSNLLSARTVDEMAALHPALESTTANGQGHAPMLHKPDVIGAIDGFVQAIR